MAPNSPFWDLVSRPQLFSEKMGPTERWHQCRGNGGITRSPPAAKRGSWHAEDSHWEQLAQDHSSCKDALTQTDVPVWESNIYKNKLNLLSY